MSRIERINLSQLVTDAMLEEIANGSLAPGDKVPTETQLMERFDVGRNTIREALQALKMMGIIEVRPGAGGVVRSTSTSQLAKYVALPKVLDAEAKNDLYDFRDFFETEIAARAATCRTSEQLTLIKERLADFEDLVSTGNATSEADVAFHAAIATATNNALFVGVMDSLSELLTNVRKETEKVPGATDTAVREHRAIVDAIERGDAEGARAAMNQHVDSGRKALGEIGASARP